MMKMTTFCNVVLVLIAFFLVVTFGYLLWSLVAIGGLPTNLITQISQITNNSSSHQFLGDSIQDVSLVVLRNSAFVLQYVSWIFTIGAFSFAALGFIGAKRLLNLRETEETINKKIMELDRSRERFERKVELISGRMKQEQEKFQEATKEADKKIEMEMDISRARLFYLQGETMEGAYTYALEILSRMPEDYSFEVLFYKGLTLMKRGDHVDAFESLDKALSFPDSDKARIYFNMGNCRREALLHDEAISLYDRAIEIRNGHYGDATINKAMAYRRKNDTKMAIKILQDCVKFDPKNVRAQYNLACYYALNSQKKEAINSLRKATELNPWKYRKLVLTDPDFDSIRGDKDFKDF